MTTEADALVRRYLDDLEHELRDVPASRRRELVDEMREHIREARAESHDGEAEVRALLDRLGDPAEIAAEEAARRDLTPARIWLVEIGALVGLALGFTFVGLLIGVALLWASRRWTTHAKVVGTLIWPGVVVFGFVLALAAAALGGGGLWLGSAELGVLLIVFIVMPLVAIVYLGLQLRNRPD